MSTSGVSTCCMLLLIPAFLLNPIPVALTSLMLAVPTWPTRDELPVRWGPVNLMHCCLLLAAGFSSALTPLPYRACPLGDLNCPKPMVAEAHSHGIQPLSATIVAADAAEALPAPAPMAAAMPRMANGPVAMAKMTAEGANNANANSGGGAAGASGAAAGTQLRLQQAFKVTPLFTTVKTKADGTVSVDFPAPDNLGRFVVRAYVAAPKAAVKSAASSNSGVVYGSGESALVVRRTVSLVPSLPRQVRVGDSFSAGVLVEAPGTVSDVTVVVTASLQQAGGSRGASSVLSLGRETNRIVTLSPSKPQQEVLFDFKADSIGMQNITFAASATGGLRGPNRGLREFASEVVTSGAVRTLKQFLAKRKDNTAAAAAAAGNVADQVQLQVPVNGKQGDVVIATSFAVRGSSDGNSWQEGMALPQAELGSGMINLIAGVGSLPAIKVGSHVGDMQLELLFAATGLVHLSFATSTALVAAAAYTRLNLFFDVRHCAVLLTTYRCSLACGIRTCPAGRVHKPG